MTNRGKRGLGTTVSTELLFADAPRKAKPKHSADLLATIQDQILLLVRQLPAIGPVRVVQQIVEHSLHLVLDIAIANPIGDSGLNKRLFEGNRQVGLNFRIA